MKIQFKFRWKIEQTSETTVSMDIKQGGVIPILDHRFIEAHKLNPDEVEAAEIEAIRAVAILP